MGSCIFTYKRGIKYSYSFDQLNYQVGLKCRQPTKDDGFVEQKNWDGKKVIQRRGYGWPDVKGNIWIPSELADDRGVHWEVQYPDGDYDLVFATENREKKQ
ncbi:MAG TPA: hypothetical protein VGT41_03630 [Candidatus Babeliales bacterium]|nr:hypothetical protein [Candidatus Babeliales bacterium]